MASKNSYKTGRLAECIARFFLLLKGYRLVRKNYVVGRGTGAGEIDLIVKKGTTLVFVEVKKRKTYQEALEAITLQHQIRIVKTSAVFLKNYPRYQNDMIRYDAVVFRDKSIWPRHIQNAWSVL